MEIPTCIEQPSAERYCGGEQNDNINMTFEELYKTLQERIALIDPVSGVFTLEVQRNDEKFGAIKVLCDDVLFVTFNYIVTNDRTCDGHRQLRSMITLRVWNDSRWYSEKLERPVVNVGNNGLCWYNGLNDRIPVLQMLDDVLPIANKDEIQQIEDEFKNHQISISGCNFNTYNNRYEIDMDLSAFLDGHIKERQAPGYLHKYMSLDTFMAMLQNKTFRMNSVVAMNDTSETFALGNAMSDELNITDRYRSLISSKNALITSFCGDGDSALMWRLYGDNGKGVCLSFSASADIVKPIVYVKKEGRDSKLSKLTEMIKMLKEEGIVGHIKQIDDLKYLVKSNQFEYENEYRLLRYEPDENLKIVKYGDLMSFCHDYEIESNGYIKDLDLKLHEVVLGRNLPNPDINYTLIVDALNREFGVDIVNWSEVDALR